MFKVNFHVTEKCNYRCGYCFADFDSKGKILSFDNVKMIVDNLVESGMVDEVNIAGGEPFCHPYLNQLIDYIYSVGLKCSIISNGSLITEDWILEYNQKLTTLGLSIDSLDESECRCIGRCCGNNVIDKKRLMDMIYFAKEVNPLIQIKINTVVSKYNLSLSVKELIEKTPIDRWKILRAKLFETDYFSNKELLISENEWLNIVKKVVEIKSFNKKMRKVIEENLVSTYIIIDPLGNVKDNSRNNNYVSIGNFLQESFENVMKNIKLNIHGYQNRYL